MRKLQVVKQQAKYQLRKLSEDITVRQEFKLKLLSRFKSLQISETEDVEDKWRAFEEVLNTSAEETIPKNKPKRKQKWMIESILDMMKERGKVKGKDGSKYKEIDIAIKEKCKEEKEAWWNKQCHEIEKEIYRNPSAAHIKVKELTGKTFCLSSRCLRSKTGTILIGKEDILNRWEVICLKKDEIWYGNRTRTHLS